MCLLAMCVRKAGIRLAQTKLQRHKALVHAHTHTHTLVHARITRSNTNTHRPGDPNIYNYGSCLSVPRLIWRHPHLPGLLWQEPLPSLKQLRRGTWQLMGGGEGGKAEWKRVSSGGPPAFDITATANGNGNGVAANGGSANSSSVNGSVNGAAVNGNGNGPAVNGNGNGTAAVNGDGAAANGSAVNGNGSAVDGNGNGAAAVHGNGSAAGNGSSGVGGNGAAANGNGAASANGGSVNGNGNSTMSGSSSNGAGKQSTASKDVSSVTSSYVPLKPGQHVALPTELGSYPHLVSRCCCLLNDDVNKMNKKDRRHVRDVLVLFEVWTARGSAY